MSGPFIELTESGTSRPMLVNIDRVTCVMPHGRGGSFICTAANPDRFEVDEPPGRISEMLRAARMIYPQSEAQDE